MRTITALHKQLSDALAQEDYTTAKDISFKIKESNMKKVSQEDLLQALKAAQDIDSMLDILLNASGDEVVDNAVHDHILTERLFPMLGEGKKTSSEVSEEKFEEFKKQFPYSDFGISEKEMDKVQKMVEEGKSIDKVISTIVKFIANDKKDEIAHEYIKNKWFVENCNSDKEMFINNIKPDFWLKKVQK